MFVREYAPGLLKLFCNGSERDAWGCWYMPKRLKFSFQIRIFPYSEVTHGSTTLKLTKVNKKVKEKWSTIKFDVFFFHFLNSNVPNNKSYKQKWHQPHQTSGACAWLCVYVIAHIKWIRLVDGNFTGDILCKDGFKNKFHWVSYRFFSYNFITLIDMLSQFWIYWNLSF